MQQWRKTWAIARSELTGEMGILLIIHMCGLALVTWHLG
jgi:hypothetical protein